MDSGELSGARRRILVVGMNYAPDFVGVPKYTTELCEELVRRGHEVEVVTGPPYYPDWKIPPGHSGRRWSGETRNGVRLVRTPLYVPEQPSGLKRLLHLASFSAAALVPALRAARRLKPHLVLTVAPSLLAAPVALAAAKAAGPQARSWLHVQDFEVDAAFELGLLKGDAARRIAARLERRLLTAFDRVSTISPNMVALLRAKGVQPDRAIEIRNWVDVDAVQVSPTTNTRYRRDLDIPQDAIVALYSGNMAGKQGLETLAEVAAQLQARAPDVIMLLCGGGPFRPELERLTAGRSNIRWLDLQPSERLPELLGTADIHLLPQKQAAADLVLPSKLTGMLASGRPVVAMAADGSSLAAEVQGCGLTTSAGDAAAMTDAIMGLAADPQLRAALGKKARHAAETVWRMSAVIDKFEAEMGAISAVRLSAQTAAA